MKQILLITAVAAALWGCTANGQASRDEMFVKASALTKVATALDGAVRFGDLPAGLAEEEMLRRAVAHDLDLLTPFGDYLLRVRRHGRLSSVLMCTKNGETGLLEDAGCTGGFDAHLWERSPAPSCSFQLDLTKVCPQ